MRKIIDKILSLIPEFPGVSLLTGSSDFVDLRDDSAGMRRRRVAGRLMLAICVLTGLLLFQVHAMLERVKTEVAVIQNKGSQVVSGGQLPTPMKSSYTVLILGKELEQRADTVILAQFIVDEKRVHVLSFPRDTRVPIKKDGELILSKLSHTFRWGGLPMLTDSMERFIQLKVDDWVVIDLAIFRKIIDTLGGVEVTVEKDLYYQDKSAGLTIDLKKGKQVLMGADAEGFVRYRSDKMGDLGRIERQQMLLKAFFERLRSLKHFHWENIKVLGRLPVFVMNLFKDVETSMDSDQILRMITAFSDIPRDQLEFRTLPGEGHYIDDFEQGKKVNYFLTSPLELKRTKAWFQGRD